MGASDAFLVSLRVLRRGHCWSYRAFNHAVMRRAASRISDSAPA